MLYTCAGYKEHDVAVRIYRGCYIPVQDIENMMWLCGYIEDVIYLCRDIENMMWLCGDIEDVICLCGDI